MNNLKEISILIGGKAGYGIDKSGFLIARLLNQLGWRVYIYRDYPSIIRGGHTFSIIRASLKRVYCHSAYMDILLALNQDTLDFHKDKLKEESLVIYDSDSVKIDSLPAGIKKQAVPLSKVIQEENSPEITRNSCIIGALTRSLGLPWSAIEIIIKSEFSKETESNLRVARRGYDLQREEFKLFAFKQESLPVLSGNQAIALGLIRAGLKTYIAYPMTPSSPILHFLAEIKDQFGIKVVHPENEIGVMLMALGFSYMGDRAVVGTSGGGFCLMTEGLSLAGMAELPIVIILGQRPGPSTGLPTYSSQTELDFALSAGHGEFLRFVVAPGDVEGSFYWSAMALNIAWKYQIPSLILVDKNLGEGVFNCDTEIVDKIKEEEFSLWEERGDFKRYAVTENNISPLAFPAKANAIVKVNSYEHDEFGITTEDPLETVKMQDKRLSKEKGLINELQDYETVKTHGNKDSDTVIICWGSNKGVCNEVAENLNLRAIQPIVLKPFPLTKFKNALKGAKKIITVESNATGQLSRLIQGYGMKVDGQILKYDGRPFSLEELTERLKSLNK